MIDHNMIQRKVEDARNYIDTGGVAAMIGILTFPMELMTGWRSFWILEYSAFVICTISIGIGLYKSKKIDGMLDDMLEGIKK